MCQGRAVDIAMYRRPITKMGFSLDERHVRYRIEECRDDECQTRHVEIDGGEGVRGGPCAGDFWLFASACRGPW
jgi:hypothetical protein